MKSYRYILFLFVLLGFVVNSCQKPERDNYWDELASYDPDDWAPINLTLEVSDINTVKLEWQQERLVEGFKIERKDPEGEWIVIIDDIDREKRVYLDKSAIMPTFYAYRVKAFVGENTSSFAEAMLELPRINTNKIFDISDSTAIGGGEIITDGGASINSRGLVWSTLENPTLLNNQGVSADGAGSGSYISNLTSLQAGTVYFVCAYATNVLGTQYGEVISFNTTGTFVLEVINPVTARTWMDRNLGAIRVAQSSDDTLAFGDYYQWGRESDGHEKSSSRTTPDLSANDNTGHGKFILINSSPYDWRNPQNDNLWQGINGINNPCPMGYRLPTEAEWNAERQSWSNSNAEGAFNSSLKLPVAGYRSYSFGSLYSVGLYGYYWAATVDNSEARFLYFNNDNSNIGSNRRASGKSLRCIKD